MEHGIGNWARAFVAGLAFAAAFAVPLPVLTTRAVAQARRRLAPGAAPAQ